MQIRISKIRVMASAVMLSLLLSAFGIGAGAQTTDTRSLAAMSTNLDPDGRVYMQIKAVLNKNVWVYERISVSVGNTSLPVQGIVINGVAYVPFRSAAAAISGSSYIYDPSTRTSVMSAPGLQIIATDGCYVTYANGRTLFNTTPNVIMSDGRMYIPAAVFAKAVGMSVNSVSGGIRLVGSYYPLLHAEKFYREDEVFWLARIIHAESRGEALIGQIAAGNVVMNRVRSAYYPNTIYGVIFDRKYGVQFSPVLDGTIYNTPGYTATLAAKICLEGYDLSGGAFFFLNTALATSSWIPLNREYAFTIGNHDFYK